MKLILDCDHGLIDLIFLFFKSLRPQGYWNWKEIVWSICCITFVELQLTKSIFSFYKIISVSAALFCPTQVTRNKKIICWPPANYLQISECRLETTPTYGWDAKVHLHPEPVILICAFECFLVVYCLFLSAIETNSFE